MLTEIQAEWVKRLRSGTIVKAPDYLHGADGKMCAIGVLCNILYERGQIDRELVGECYVYDRFVAFPSNKVKQHMGVRVMPIINMNDSKSFKKIADYIEGELS